MAVYRMRVAFEDNEDIVRDIEIKSNQTFLELHSIIQESIKFDSKHAASFFTSDDYWRKDKEITLLDEDKDKDNYLMSQSKISSFVETPYQRFVYVYDKNVQWTLLVELIKILPDNPKGKYPSCVRTSGNAPKQYRQQNLANKGPISPEVAMANMLEDELLDQDAYKHANEESLALDEDDTLEGTEVDPELASSESEEEDDFLNSEDDDGEDNFESGFESSNDDDKY